MMESAALLLTRQWRDTPQGIELEIWAASDDGPLRLLMSETEAVVFARATDLPAIRKLIGSTKGWRYRTVALRDLAGQPVVALYFRRQRAIYDLRDRLREAHIPLYESDIKPSDRFLMERFARGGITVRGDPATRRGYLELTNPQLKSGPARPGLKTAVVDIETTPDARQLLSIAALAGTGGEVQEEVVWMIEPDAAAASTAYSGVRNEKELLTALQVWLGRVDPDVILGWNVINFDLKVLEDVARRLRFRWAPGRANTQIHWRKSNAGDGHYTVLMPGRLVLDGIDVLRTAMYRFDSFALDNVAQQLLGRGKKTDDVSGRSGWIQEAFQEDKATLAAYNLEDCRLVWDIAEKTQMIDFALARAELTGLQADRVGGSVAAFDQRYLPLLHRQGYVAPDVGTLADGTGSPGGYVMDSRPGLYRNVLVLDFKSLYPSIIRTFHVDPLGLARSAGEPDPIPGYNNASFSRRTHILPGLITDLWAARDQAKAAQDTPLATAIKILMNSFYGVLGTPGCRFFDPRLASAITLRGHEVLQRSRDWIASRGFEVIYGDTDSVFVWAGNAMSRAAARQLGHDLAGDLNTWWTQTLRRELRLDSFLEMEFETHYVHFFMPAVRGSDAGSKKRYAGMIRETESSEPKVIFKGLEAIRTDWSELAREFQKTLYEMIFLGQPFEDFVRDTVKDTRRGKHDDQLTLRKRLGRHPGDYQAALPPHVRAAKAEDEARKAAGDPKRYRRGDWVEYIQTKAGPETLYCQSATPDRELYVTRQLKPVADAILEFVGSDFEALTGPQLGLFE